MYLIQWSSRQRLLKQGNVAPGLKSLLHKFHGRHHDLVNRDETSISQLTMDRFPFTLIFLSFTDKTFTELDCMSNTTGVFIRFNYRKFTVHPATTYGTPPSISGVRGYIVGWLSIFQFITYLAVCKRVYQSKHMYMVHTSSWRSQMPCHMPVDSHWCFYRKSLLHNTFRVHFRNNKLWNVCLEKKHGDFSV